MPLTRITSRLALGAALAGALFFLGFVAWGIAAPPASGHVGEGLCPLLIAAENIVRLPFPHLALHYATAPPDVGLLYCHHPYGAFYAQAASYWLAGHSWMTGRLPALGYGLVSLVAIYEFSRAAWGHLAAAVATVTYVFVPIDLAFGAFAGLETATIAFGLLYSWGTLRALEGRDRRWLVVAGIGAVGACNGDWPGIVLVLATAGFAWLRAAVDQRRIFPVGGSNAETPWLGGSILVALGAAVAYVAIFARLGHLGDLVSSYEVRASGMAHGVSGRRFRWIGWMLTPMGLALLGISLPILLRRTARSAERVVLGWYLAASVQYVAFPEAADIHIFWPHYFGPCIALGAAALVGAMPDTFLVGVSGAVALMARAAVPIAELGRETGGTFDETTFNDSSAIAQVTAAMAAGLPPRALLGIHGIDDVARVEYSAARPVVEAPLDGTDGRSAEAADRFVLADARRISVEELGRIAHRYAVVAIGPFWWIDRAGAAEDLRALAYTENVVPPRRAFFRVAADAQRTIGPGDDPWAAWLWGDALGVPVAPPGGEPRTFEQRVTAYDVAIATGDLVRAHELRAQILEPLTGERGVAFEDDIHLLAAGAEGALLREVTVLWETGARFVPKDVMPRTLCRVVRAPALWPVPLDPGTKEVAPGMALGPAGWKPGRLYVQRFTAVHRNGREACAIDIDGLARLGGGSGADVVFE